MSGGGPTNPVNPSAASAPNPYSPPAAPIDAGGLGVAEERGFKSALPLANVIAGVMALFVLAEVLVAANAIVGIGVMQPVVAGETLSNVQLAAINHRTSLLNVLLRVLWVPAIVAYCLFMPRANRNARAFGSRMSNTPGWAAGWFFVPIVYLWKPYYAMKEIWQGSEPDPTVHPFDAPVSSLLPLWWWMYLAFLFSRQLFSAANREELEPSAYLAMSWLRLVICVITIVAAFLAAAVVRRLALRQEERQRRHPAGSPLPAAPIGGAAP